MTVTDNQVPGESPNFRSELARELAELVPEAVSDGKIDFDALKRLIADDLEVSKERFGLTWPGKSAAMRAAQEPTSATLIPDREKSKNWDTTQNVFIEGDNLEVLKVLQRHYYNKIKLIYIDPPYNTGKDFIYPDNFREGLQTYLEWTKQVNEDGAKLSSNTESEGRFHSNWLNMMYPRLKLARNLLTDDGAIILSIDDSERDALFRLGCEIFGESNFVASMVWAAGRKNDSKYVSVSHEYILIFAKNRAVLNERVGDWKVRKDGIDEIYAQVEKLCSEEDDLDAASARLKTWFRDLPPQSPAKRHKHYSNIDERGVYFAGDISWPGGGGPKYEVLHPETGKPVRIPAGGWRFQEDSFRERVSENRVKFGADESTVPTYKRYLSETEYESPYSVFYQDGRAATKRLTSLMGKKVFDFPKDEEVLARIIEMSTSGQDCILDFFSGSGTTAHAVMEQNARDGGERRHIQVQLPEPIGELSQHSGEGFLTIADIARERISRAGETVTRNLAEKDPNRQRSLDTGYRTYCLSDTNFEQWGATSDVDRNDLEQHLFDLRESADDDASPESLLTELILKLGFSLSEQVIERKIGGLELFDVSNGLLLAYMNEHQKPSLDQLHAMVDIVPGKIVIIEDAFQGDDELKTNLKKLCAARDIELWTA